MNEISVPLLDSSLINKCIHFSILHSFREILGGRQKLLFFKDRHY